MRAITDIFIRRTRTSDGGELDHRAHRVSSHVHAAHPAVPQAGKAPRFSSLPTTSGPALKLYGVFLTTPIEQAVSSIAGIDYIESSSAREPASSRCV